MADTIESRLAAAGVTLPQAAAPAANYVPYAIAGPLLQTSGQLPLDAGKVAVTGKLGAGVTLEDGQKAARHCAINILAQAKAALGGDWSRVKRLVKLTVLRRKRRLLHRAAQGGERSLGFPCRDSWRGGPPCALGRRRTGAADGRRRRDRGAVRDRLTASSSRRTGDRQMVTEPMPEASTDGGSYTGRLGWMIERPIAHRGLHDGNVAVPENSLPAALAAIAGGYAIECDVQLSAEGTPHVFHDDTLDRLCGRPGRFRDLADADIAALRLAGTDATIATVAAFLAAIDGRVPIVMELKGLGAQADAGYFERLAPVISGYRGDLALMSFDVWLIDQMLAAGHERPVGLTAEGTTDKALADHLAVFARGCDFVSYNVHHLPNAFTGTVRRDLRAPVISWTVRTPEDVAQSRAHCDQMTFEGFAPQH